MNRSLLILGFLLLSQFSFSQTKVSGKVIAETGDPVPFANVIFKNSSEGTTTDEDGEFYLQSEADQDTLEISFIGFRTYDYVIKSSVDLNISITLEEEASTLDAVTIYRGKTSKKNNPAIDILRKVWENRRKNGVEAFNQYAYKEYEKLEFDLNSIDTAIENNRIFKGMEFIFDYKDTNRVTGKSFLPMFINESVTMIYGDNERNLEKEELVGNKNSGFSENQNLINFVKNVYDDYDIYKRYIKFFDKSFVSPVSTTGIDSYNYILKDSAYIDDKWCYQIVYYPRRQNELTFSGDFWVNDTTWAVKKINLETSRDANINWVKQVYIEQDYDVLNDSIFLIKRDFFMADFSLNKKKDSRGVYAKRTQIFDDFEFNEPKPAEFYQDEVYNPRPEIYDRDSLFWKQNRLEKLNDNEEEIYTMLDSLTKTKAFNRIYNIATIAESGYIEFDGWDFGPVYSLFGYNDVEGLRTRIGGRTYFGQHDPWRIEGYMAYGFKDEKFKYGILGKIMVDPELRLILSGGHRQDVEQLGTNLTNSTDVLGRSLASSSLIGVGANDKLSRIKLSVFSVELEPVKNLELRFSGNHRIIEPASPGFNMDFIKEDGTIKSHVDQTELSTIVSWTPGRKVSGFGVEREIVNDDNFPTLFLNYSLGVQNVFASDFDYERLQLFYNQPLLIGGFGRSNLSFEAGKTFGGVPLALMNVVPGNQTYFAMYNTFPVLDFYEFVTDSYAALHFQHNFNGRLFSRIPLLRDLNLRELAGFRTVVGNISDESRQIDASGIPLTAPDEKPYFEYSVGVGNIFKILRIDAHFRGNYFEIPDSRNFAITFDFGFHF